MMVITDYSPPTAFDLAKLKHALGYTGTQMAQLAGVSSNSQWRKYTCGDSPRPISSHILFFTAAQLALNESEMNKVISKMKEIGASFGEIK
ncbi:XRE family transcriptional regulator [Enterobacter asburiae]|nr:XRE family transcriptional regulator [Enterobacter asburiae]